MKLTLSLFMLFMLTFFSGCATVPVPYEQAKSVPPTRLFPELHNYQTPCQECAHVIIVRDKGSYGSMWACHIYYDGKELGALRTEEKIEFYVPLGEQIIGYFMGPGGSGNPIENSFYFREPKSYFFRVSVNGQGTLLTPTSLIK